MHPLNLVITLALMHGGPLPDPDPEMGCMPMPAPTHPSCTSMLCGAGSLAFDGLTLILSAPSEAEVKSVIDRLGDDDFQVRQKAHADLRSMGRWGYVIMARNREHEDREIASRCQRLAAETYERRLAEIDAVVASRWDYVPMLDSLWYDTDKKTVNRDSVWYRLLMNSYVERSRHDTGPLHETDKRCSWGRDNRAMRWLLRDLIFLGVPPDWFDTVIYEMTERDRAVLNNSYQVRRLFWMPFK